MANYEIEMKYFRSDVKMAMGANLSSDKIKEIGANSKVRLSATDSGATGVSWVTVKMSSDDEIPLRQCVKEIVRLYGKPDLPGSLFGGAAKKKGKELVVSVMNELGIK